MIDRLPPHSLDAEKGVLGCLLLSEPAVLVEALGDGRMVGADDFYDPIHRAVFMEIRAQVEAGKPVDQIALAHTLTARQVVPGPLAFLSALVDFVPSAANLGYYADIVRETSVRRSAARACAESLECIHGPPGPVETLLDEMEARVLAVRDRRHLPVETTLLDRVRNIVERWEAGSQGRSAELATGFPDLDCIMGGLRDSEIIVLAARPSTGKTALALDMIRHVAGQGIPVGLFSLEMDGDSLTERMIAAESRLNPRHALAWTPLEIQRCSTAAGRLARLPIHIDDSPSLSVNAIRARARRWQRRHGVRLIVIDYLQLVTSDGRDRREAVDAISRGLKSLAKELRLPVVVLAQLNRDVERENNRRPRLSDLRESGQIEQDADVVGMLYKADPDLAPDEPVMPINLDICKHRNGPLGTVRLVFFREHTRFESAARGGQVSN